MHRSVLVLILALVLSACSNGQGTATAEKLSAVEFSKQIGSGDTVQLIDVRTEAEFEIGHIAGAVNLPVQAADFDQRLEALDKSRPVYLYCLSGGRSAAALQAFSKTGFKHIVEMPGGMQEWRARGLPETKMKAAPIASMGMEEYERLLSSDTMVLIDFYADWCGPCKRMKPFLDKMAVEMQDRVKIVRIDADAHPDLCSALRVEALPDLRLYQNKQLVWSKSGFASEEELRKVLQ